MRVRIIKKLVEFLSSTRRGPVHDITTLANEASDVMGSGWRRLTVYPQKNVKISACCNQAVAGSQVSISACYNLRPSG